MFKKIWSIVLTLLMLVVVALACIFFVPKLFGITPMAVLSGSMEPSYHVGGLVFVKSVDPASIEIGDPITFQLAGAETVVTHRVIQIDSEKKTFETKGDANEKPDGSQVAFSSVKGKAFDFSIPFLGYLAVFMGSTQGIIVLSCAIVLLVILSYIPNLLSKSEEKKKN